MADNSLIEFTADSPKWGWREIPSKSGNAKVKALQISRQHHLQRSEMYDCLMLIPREDLDQRAIFFNVLPGQQPASGDWIVRSPGVINTFYPAAKFKTLFNV